MPGLGHLVRDMQQAEARCSLFERFRKVWRMSQEKLLVRKSHREEFGWACKLGRAGSQGITRAEQTVLAKLMETQIWLMPADSVGGKWSQKRNNSLFQHFHLWESCPSSLHPEASSSMYVPGTFQAAAPVLEWVQVSLCMGLFRGMPGTPEALCLFQP